MKKSVMHGRAYVRLIEAADMLLAGHPDEAERVLLEQVRKTYKLKVRALVAEAPAEVSAQVLAASKKVNTPANDFVLN